MIVTWEGQGNIDCNVDVIDLKMRINPVERSFALRALQMYRKKKAFKTTLLLGKK